MIKPSPALCAPSCGKPFPNEEVEELGLMTIPDPDKERPADEGATVVNEAGFDRAGYEIALAFASLECVELKAEKRERHQCPGIVNLAKYVSTT